MKDKYKIFEKKKLTTMVIEIDISKCDKNFKQLLGSIQQLEKKELINYDLEVKDVYFK